MRHLGLPVPAHVFVTGAAGVDAALLGRLPGARAVVKVVSPQILHKTEVGGVRVGIKDDAAMRAEFASLTEGVRSKQPDADIWGVLVQQMAPKGVETILGMKRDKAFGALLMFGLGGVMVEVLKDVTFRIAPLNEVSADMMITSIKSYKLLQAFRGQPARDTAKIRECLLRLSQLVMDFPEFDEIDINPLLAYEEGKGALVLDARFLLK